MREVSRRRVGSGVLSACLAALVPAVGFGAVAGPFSIGSTGTDYGKGLAVDPSDGSFYAAGYFTGSVDFGRGASGLTRNAVGFVDNYLVKYDAAGTPLWAVTSGSAGADIPHTVKLDPAGNVYVSGYFSGPTNFNPAGSATRASQGGRDAYVAKYSRTGAFLSAIAFGSAGLEDAFDFAVDAQQNVYVAGTFQNTVDFDPRTSFTTTLTARGAADGYVAKYATTGAAAGTVGQLLWARQFGTDTDDATGVAEQAMGLSLDAAGSVYVSGAFRGQASIGSVSLTSAGGSDGYLAKLDADGNVLRAQRFGGSLDDTPIPGGLLIDPDGRAVIGGNFRSTNADFDPSDTAVALRAATGGLTDAFVVQLSAAGAFEYAATFGGSGTDGAHRFVRDAAGNLYLTGYASGQNFDLDPGPGVRLVSTGGSGGATDILMMSLTDAGAFRWANVIGPTIAGDFDSLGTGIGLTPDQQLLVHGVYFGTADFAPGPGASLLTSAGDSDAFLAPFTTAGAAVPEPGAGALLGVTALGLCRRRRS